MPVHEYYRGQQVHLTATLTNLQGSVADATSVVFHVRNPSGAVATYPVGQTATRLAAGVYALDLDTSPVAGLYEYRCVATGGLVAAEEAEINIKGGEY